MTRAELVAQRKLFISAIVPVHNEEENIVPFTKALTTMLQSVTEHYEIVLIDDGSTDNSAKIIESTLLKQTNVKLLALSRNFGKEIALTAGLEHCQGDVAMIIDADFQQPVETLTQFLEQWQAGFDMIYAIRKDRHDEPWLKRFLTQGFYQLIDCLSATKIPRNASDFRLLDRKVIDALNQCGETTRFLKGLYAWVGFNTTGIVYEPKERKAGKTSFSLHRLFSLALTGIFSFSDIPLRIWSVIGMLISGASLIYAIVIVLKTIIYGVDVPGFATLAAAIMFFGGIQLFSIGILGEYIGRIFREVKQRPKYIIKKSIGFERKS